MQMKRFPVIDPVATGANILRLRKERGLTVRDLQSYFGFEEPQAIYKWQRGQSLPTVDNLYALGALLDVPMEEILVQSGPKLNIVVSGQQAESCCSVCFICSFGYGRSKIRLPLFSHAFRQKQVHAVKLIKAASSIHLRFSFVIELPVSSPNRIFPGHGLCADASPIATRTPQPDRNPAAAFVCG